jgi:hypothetical protein
MGAKMNLLLNRDQKSAALFTLIPLRIGSGVMFQLHAELELDEDETSLIKKYKFEKSLLVSSDPIEDLKMSFRPAALLGIVAFIVFWIIGSFSAAFTLGLLVTLVMTGVGMVLAHQFLGQLDAKLQEAISANTSIKFAGGVSAKDARALAADLRTESSFVEGQDKLSFAAFVKGTTRHAVSISVTAGEMEAEPRMSAEDREKQRDTMRAKYAVHYSEVVKQAGQSAAVDDAEEEASTDPDNDEPMPWT